MKKQYLLGSLLLCVAALSVRADISPTNAQVNPPAEGANFRWNYNTNVDATQRVETGNYFTIYDFAGLIPGSNLQPTGWVFSTALLGVTPSIPGQQVVPLDDPNVLNLTWTYTGANPINGAAFLGIFSVLSNSNQMRFDNFTALGTRNVGPNAGDAIANIGTVGVPVPEMSALAPIIGVCGLGFIGIFSSLLRRRNVS